MSTILSTRCDPRILQQIQQTAKAENGSLREIIERIRVHYQQETIRKKIRDSYTNMDDESVALAEEDMSSYFKTLSMHE